MRGAPSSRPDFHREHTKNVRISGGNFVLNNQPRVSNYHDNSQTFNTRKKTTVFNDRVYGYIRNANTEGPITGYRQETHTAHQDGRVDSEATEPRSLKQHIPSASHVLAINHDKHHDHGAWRHDHFQQSAHHTTRTSVTARHDRPVAKIASGKKELGPLSLTGPPMDDGLETELLRLSPQMQGYVKHLQATYTQRMDKVPVQKGRKGQGQTAVTRKPHEQLPQWADDSNNSSCDETYPEDQLNF